jgi:hypothetical protein
MTTGAYTPLQLIAGAGLLDNQGIDVPAALVNAISDYNNLQFIQDLQDTIDNGTTWGLSSSVITTLSTLTANTVPALSASIPIAYANSTVPVQSAPIIPVSIPGGFGNLILTTAQKYLGNGDISKFVTVFSTVVGFQGLTQQLIYTAVNSTIYLGPTFTSMDDLITNDLTSVNLALPAFSEDLSNLGQLIDLSNLDFLGTPAGLLQQISKKSRIVKGTIPCIATALALEGLTTEDIADLATPGPDTFNRRTANNYNSLQKRAYNAFKQIRGECLQTVLDILEVNMPELQSTNPNNSLADLLDIQKLFPNSYLSLKTPTPDGNALIFNNDGSVNSNVVDVLINQYTPRNSVTGCNELAKIVPGDQAVSSSALASSLQQIRGIANMTLPDLSKLAAELETLKGLPTLQCMPGPIPDSVTDYYQTNVATGSGDYGVFEIDDFLGTASGRGIVNQLITAVATLNSMPLSTLSTIYARMLAAVQNTYGPYSGPIVIPAGPAAGTYTDGDDAFVNGLIPAAVAEVAALTVAYPEQTSDLNNIWDSISNKILTEAQNQLKAGVNWDELPVQNQSAIISFISNLSRYGLNDCPGEASDFLTQVVNSLAAAGQAIIAALREARNRRNIVRVAPPGNNDRIPFNWPGPVDIGAAARTISNISIPCPPPDEPAPPEYQSSDSVISTDYTVDEARLLAIAQCQTDPAFPSPQQTAEILGWYFDDSGKPGELTSILIAGNPFWARIRIRPTTPDTSAVFSTSATVNTVPVSLPEQASNQSGIFYPLPGWLVPNSGSVTLTISVSSTESGDAQFSQTLTVVNSYFPETVTVSQQGWFRHLNDVDSGSLVNILITGEPLTNFDYSGALGVGSGTLDLGGRALVSGISAPPVGTYNVSVIYAYSGNTVTQEFTVHG